jgi:DNA polymerase-3 subunit delta
MKINRSQQLIPSLKKELKPVVWIAGDEPLLLQENADAVRKFCQQAGFEERETFNVDRGFDWSLFNETADNLSLFASRKLIELRLSSAKLEDPGKQALQDYAAAPNPDYLVLITSPRVEPAAARTRWFKDIDAAAWFVPVWPVSVDELPDWLSQRLIKAGVHPTPDAIQLLVQRIEGNLLAAVQEIEKLKLLTSPSGGNAVELDAEMILQSVADSSRYTSFTLIDSALSGDSKRTLKILRGLKNEGVDPLAILGPSCSEFRRLLPALQQVEAGQPVARVTEELVGKNFKRKASVNRALQRLRSAQIYALLDQARQVDCAVKGISAGDPWLELENLFLRVCGTTIPALQRTG